MTDCIFCKDLPKVLENEMAYALYDIKPLSKGHMLVIPRRHHTTVFESTSAELNAAFDLLTKAKAIIQKEHDPDGYNVIANCGPAAGQVVMHAHFHLIPRYK